MACDLLEAINTKESDAQKWVNDLMVQFRDILDGTDFVIFILCPLSKKRGYKKLVKQFTEINTGRFRYCLGTREREDNCEFYLCFGKDVTLLTEIRKEYTKEMVEQILCLVNKLAFPINGFLNKM